MRKILILILVLLLTPLLFAQDYKLDISTPSELVESGKNMTFKVTLLDQNNNPINDHVEITIYDSWERPIIETEVNSNELTQIFLEKTMISGQSILKASYGEINAIKVFEIKEKELASFEIQGENLIVTNIGNTKYERKIEIQIGKTTGIKSPSLEVGKSVSYRLIAPEGVYNIKVSDGLSEDLVISEIKLTGTGNVIGAIDESLSQRSGITGINPEADENVEFFSYVKNSKFSYVFILVIFGAMVLLAIERNVQRKNSTPQLTAFNQTQISYK